MKVIFMNDLKNHGEEGDIKEVKAGFARNFLIPRNIAVPYNKGNLVILGQKQRAIARRKEEKQKNALGLRERIESESLEIFMNVGEKGRLFGSVTNLLVAQELLKKGIEIDRKAVDLAKNSIKNTGDYNLKIKLYNNEYAELKLKVSPVAEEVSEKKIEEEPEPAEEAVSEELDTEEEKGLKEDQLESDG